MWIVAVLATLGCAKAPPPQPPAPAPAASVEPADSSASAPTLDDLRRRLVSSRDNDARVGAIDDIAKAGSQAKAAIDDLVKATADSNERVRWHAARAIGLIGEEAIASIPTLVKLLADKDPIVVAQAAAAIGAIRADDERTATPEKDVAIYAAAVKPLSETAFHPDARARRAALRALQSMPLTVEQIAPLFDKQLADADPSVVLPALHTLADMGDDAVPVLVESLKEPKARYWAAVALAEIGPDAAPATEPLTALVANGEPEERLQAILTLAAIGDRATPAVPAIIKALESDDSSLRFAAAFALGQMRAAAADKPLEKTAADPDPFLAAVASWARARIHPDDNALRDEAVKRLRAGLTSDRAKVRVASASGLSDLAASLDQPAKRQLADQFATLLADADPAVGTSAGAALIRLGADAVDTLRRTLAAPTARNAALEILAAIGPPAKPAAADMIALLADPDEQTQSDAAVALAALGADAAKAVPALDKILADESAPAGSRYAAAYALGRIGAPAQAAIGTLRRLIAAEDELLATVAVWAALKVVPQDKSLVEAAMPKLRKALRGDRDLARLEAAVALGDIGPGAESAIPLLELVEEDDPIKAVRAAAAEALTKIRGGR